MTLVSEELRVDIANEGPYGARTVARVVGVVGRSTLSTLQGALELAAECGGELIVDLGEATFGDLSGFDILEATVDHLRAGGIRVSFAHPEGAEAPEPPRDPTGGVRVFLLEDHELVRESLRRLLEAEGDLSVVGEAATAAEALVGLPLARPTVAVIDVRLPDGNGPDVCREIRSRMPEVACVILTAWADDGALFASIMAGAAGYLPKQVRGSDLVGDIRRASCGQSLVDPEFKAAVMEQLNRRTACA